MSAEIDRLKREYQARDEKMYSAGWKGDIYHPRHPMGRLFHEHRQQVVTDALNAIDFALEEAHVLDVGCGDGGWLRLLVELGAAPPNLTGMDLSQSRIDAAGRAHPGIRWLVIDGENLPSADGQFDMVLQATVFSSILDEALAARLAGEMWRVTKPGGYVLWTDLLHGDPARLRAYPLESVRRLFPAARLVYQRRAYPTYFRTLYRHPRLCRLLSSLSDARAEYLVAVLKKD